MSSTSEALVELSTVCFVRNCALIGQTVEQAEDQPDRLALMFPNDVRVEMLKSSPDTGPEVAHFVPIVDGVPDVASMLIWENLIPTRGDAAGA